MEATLPGRRTLNTQATQDNDIALGSYKNMSPEQMATLEVTEGSGATSTGLSSLPASVVALPTLAWERNTASHWANDY